MALGQKGMKQPQKQIGLNFATSETVSLEDFVVGENEAVIAALKLARDGVGPQFIYLWGATGVGKTLLISSMGGDRDVRVPRFSSDVSLYGVDDVDRLDDAQAEALFHLMNDVRAHPQCRLIVSGAKPVHELELREDVKSRLAWGLNFEVRPLDEAGARNEFKRLAKERGIEVTEDMDHWIGTHCPRDMRWLRVMLDRIDQYAIEKKRRVNLALLTQFAKERL